MIVRGDLLRDQVKEEIVKRILDGRLEALSRINESVLSVDLGVSRTPLREALLSLEQDGFVQAQPGRGFRVAALSAREVRDIYPIVGVLEALALRTSDPLPATAALRELNDEIARSQDDPDRCEALDTELHRLLFEGCGNARLVDTIGGVKRIMKRYEIAYMRTPRTMASTIAEHEAIIAVLERGDREAASAAIEDNWRNGMERLLEILRDAGHDSA